MDLKLDLLLFLGSSRIFLSLEKNFLYLLLFSCSVVSDSFDHMDCSMPGFLYITNFWSLLKLMSIESVMPSNHLILCHSLLPLPSIFLSIRVFSNELAVHIRWQKYWSFSPSNEYSRLISFRTDWFDLLAIQKTLKFSTVQFSHSVVSDSLQPPGLQHARPPCPSPTPGVYSKSSPLSQ